MSEVASDDSVYLRSTTKIEPLCARWAAWSHLISPVQQALNLQYRQLPMLRSFVANPAIHVATSGDPEFLCAPFLQLKSSDVQEVRSLLEDTTHRCAVALGLAQDLFAFEQLLRERANGYSIDEFYPQIPASLAGLVELTYDLCHRPQLRVLEELVYDDALPNAFGQEFCFFDSPDSDRKFFLNTPRLKRPDCHIETLEFRDPRFDTIARARIEPTSFAALAAELRLDDEGARSLRRFFTSDAPTRVGMEHSGDDVRIRYFGHACVLIQTARTSVLVDPMTAWDRDDAAATLTFDDLPDRIDYVFLTHNHQDHFHPEIMLQLRHRVGSVLVPRNNVMSIADPSLKLTLKSMGFPHVVVMDPLDTIELEEGCITSLPFFGEHADLSINSKHGLALKIKGRTLLFLADSDCRDAALYRRLAVHIGHVDALFIGMECDGAPLSWLYGPYLVSPPSRKIDESRRLSGSNSERAWAVVEAIGCDRAFVYAMGQEPWLRHLVGLQYEPDSIQLVEAERFVDRCKKAGIPSERLNGCRDMLL
jgi:L-ascorbate metabolism protein UlaG (beta-lactamase superfamily)